MNLSVRHLLDIDSLTPSDIRLILDTADTFLEVAGRPIKKVPALRGKIVVNLFAEPSTRTRTSFELAEKRLSADTINMSGGSSSLVKGETLQDTALTLEAMRPDFIVIRHNRPGAPHMIAKICRASVVNAGDGPHEHPTQALLDAMTMRQRFGRLHDLRVVILGDITHSRVARSNIHLMRKLGSEVCLCGPRTLIPPGIESLGVTVSDDPDSALEGADVAMVLRMQLERQHASFVPNLVEYARTFGLDKRRAQLLDDDGIVMHPGPMNRGIEISSEVADSDRAVILDQVANGVAVRMAVLYLLSGGEREEPAAQTR